MKRLIREEPLGQSGLVLVIDNQPAVKVVPGEVGWICENVAASHRSKPIASIKEAQRMAWRIARMLAA